MSIPNLPRNPIPELESVPCSGEELLGPSGADAPHPALLPLSTRHHLLGGNMEELGNSGLEKGLGVLGAGKGHSAPGQDDVSWAMPEC